MDKLQQGHELLREEAYQRKTQMSLVMEIQQALLTKEGNPTPISTLEMVTPLHLPGFTSCHGMPHEYHL